MTQVCLKRRYLPTAQQTSFWIINCEQKSLLACFTPLIRFFAQMPFIFGREEEKLSQFLIKYDLETEKEKGRYCDWSILLYLSNRKKNPRYLFVMNPSAVFHLVLRYWMRLIWRHLWSSFFLGKTYVTLISCAKILQFCSV